jgi:DNA-binding PadR family transcriptional regulator
MLGDVEREHLMTEQYARAMRSPIAWAVLGLVIERPSYGYELTQRFRRTYGETLVLSSPKTIYNALDALKARVFIEELAPAEPGPPEPGVRGRLPRPHYRATEQGVRAYQDWLFIQIEEERQRSRLFARQLAMLEPNAALDVIDQYERECLDETDKAAAGVTEKERVAERLADEDEHLGLEMRLAWLDYARTELHAVIEEGVAEKEGVAEEKKSA